MTVRPLTLEPRATDPRATTPLTLARTDGTRPLRAGAQPAGVAGPSLESTTAVLSRLEVPYATFDAAGRCTALSRAVVALLGAAAERVCRFAVEWLATHRPPAGDAWPCGTTVSSPDRTCVLRVQQFADGGAPARMLVLVLPTRAPGTSIDGSLWGMTPRETEVASLIAAGASTKDIGAALGISPHTARRHTERVFARLGVTSRTQVVAMLGARGGASSTCAPAAKIG